MEPDIINTKKIVVFIDNRYWAMEPDKWDYKRGGIPNMLSESVEAEQLLRAAEKKEKVFAHTLTFYLALSLARALSLSCSLSLSLSLLLSRSLSFSVAGCVYVCVCVCVCIVCVRTHVCMCLCV
jgi:hypothetical protein